MAIPKKVTIFVTIGDGIKLIPLACRGIVSLPQMLNLASPASNRIIRS
jgi:hypothetical protein